ncbi:MAG: hypothetical protein D6790_14200 [Caldilineae bacterium]|nr:MAG: hypothetical protein D6790_14200 [Caldilineae bacterium]
MLRLLGALLKTLAWIALVSSIGLALFIGLGGPLLRQGAAEVGVDPGLMGQGGSGGLVVGAGVMLAGVAAFLVLFAAGESIFLQLAIEENTRMTAALLLRMEEKQGQVD